MPSIVEITPVIRQVESAYLGRKVELEIFYPPHFPYQEEVHLLLLNDGQDAAGLFSAEMLAGLYADQRIEPVIIVAIRSANRLQEYGIAGISDFQGRGTGAADYTKFITLELPGFITSEIPFPVTGKRAFAGCSLGGLSAFDIAWNNDGLFNLVGVFSGSFWWRSRDLADNYTDADRIMHRVIRGTGGRPALKFWLMAGTEDEKADRNNNFIIDSIDDTIDIIKELMAKGYSRPDEICYYEKIGGQHNIATWASVMPAFLIWAFGRKIYL